MNKALLLAVPVTLFAVEALPAETLPQKSPYQVQMRKFMATLKAADFEPTHPYDDQFYRIIDVRDLSRPREAGRWWYPGTRKGDSAPPPARLDAKFDMGFRAHNTNVFPKRPGRAYIGYIDGGAVILDISNKGRPKLVSLWRYSPPFNGMCHTVLPLLDRDLLIVSDECVQDDGADWPKLVRVVDEAFVWSVPRWVFTHRGLPVPEAAARAVRGGLGPLALILDDGTLIYSQPAAGPLSDGAYVMPGTLRAELPDLQAIRESLTPGLPVYFH